LYGILARRRPEIAVAKGVYRDPPHFSYDPGDPPSRVPSVPCSLPFWPLFHAVKPRAQIRQPSNLPTH